MKIFVGGVHASGPGYPNAKNTVSILRGRLGVEVVECGRWLGDDQHLWKMTSDGRGSSASMLARLLLGNVASVVRVIKRINRKRDAVYVPYPSLPFMFLMSWIPRRWRPRCIVDAYILIWDAVVRDRSKLSENGIASKLLKWMEARSLRAANMVLVDTKANKTFIEETYRILPARVISIALAVHESSNPVAPVVRADAQRTVRVLFVGTFVPLHGVDVLAQAINALKNHDSISFRVIGDGQDACRFQSILAGDVSNLDWYRGWSSTEAIAEEIAAADICLGVFGGSGKAARVFPLKLYHYLAHGKAVITQEHFSLPENSPKPPMQYVDSADAEALPRALRELASMSEIRKSLGREARSFYEDYLSNEIVAKSWRRLLKELA